MWDASTSQLEAGRVRRIEILDDGEPLSCKRLVQCWKQDETFRSFFVRLLAEAPFDACFWEMPPLTRNRLDRPFECVLVDAPALSGVSADRNPFAAYFGNAGAEAAVVGFANLGNDAFLVAPTPGESPQACSHLAAFSRGAPLVQQHALWQRVGSAVDEHLSDRPLWISTSGLGVYWLHVRLDRWPKYYTYHPYTLAGEPGL